MRSDISKIYLYTHSAVLYCTKCGNTRHVPCRHAKHRPDAVHLSVASRRERWMQITTLLFFYFLTQRCFLLSTSQMITVLSRVPLTWPSKHCILFSSCPDTPRLSQPAWADVQIVASASRFLTAGRGRQRGLIRCQKRQEKKEDYIVAEKKDPAGLALWDGAVQKTKVKQCYIGYKTMDLKNYFQKRRSFRSKKTKTKTALL